MNTLRGVESELRNIMRHMTVDEHDPNVDPFLSEAERLNRLPSIGNVTQNRLQRDRCHSWLDCFIEYLHKLRREPDSAVVLPPFIASRIFMQLPPHQCLFH